MTKKNQKIELFPNWTYIFSPFNGIIILKTLKIWHIKKGLRLQTRCETLFIPEQTLARNMKYITLKNLDLKPSNEFAQWSFLLTCPKSLFHRQWIEYQMIRYQKKNKIVAIKSGCGKPAPHPDATYLHVLSSSYFGCFHVMLLIGTFPILVIQ